MHFIQDPVKTEEIKKLAKKLHAYDSIECSAFTGEGVEEVFQSAIKASLDESRNSNGFNCCILL